MLLPRSAIPQRVPRALKLASALHPILIQSIQKVLPHLYQDIRISKVEMTPCLQQAKIYIYSNNPEILKLLELENWRIRKELAARANLRAVPRLRFIIDKEIINLMKAE